MEETGRSPWFWLRVALVVFVLAWILGPSVLRDNVPILLVFLVALGLELNFLVSALRGTPSRIPDRSPQETDRDRMSPRRRSTSRRSGPGRSGALQSASR